MISSETQKDFDIHRYMGTWYEISRVPNFPWEKDCDFATAFYTFNPETKTINIRNTCLDSNKNVKRESFGIAKPTETPSKLKVKFEESPYEGDYYVNWTDYTKYAIVGGPAGQFVWILSRTETVPKKDFPFLLNKIKSFGYNPDKIFSSSKFFY